MWNARPVDTAEGPALELTYVSKDGEEGYPGTVTARTVYTLTNDNELKVEMEATTDATTLVNMAHHSYWNLGGHDSGTILDHELTLYADEYTPGSPMVPDGEVKPVKRHTLRLHPRQTDRPGSEAGRRHAGRLRPQLRGQRRADSTAPGGPAQGSQVRPGHDGVRRSTRRAVLHRQLPGRLDQGQGRRAYGQYAGLCLETQKFPNAINVPAWRDQVILSPGQAYRHVMVHAFSAER